MMRQIKYSKLGIFFTVIFALTFFLAPSTFGQVKKKDGKQGRSKTQTTKSPPATASSIDDLFSEFYTIKESRPKKAQALLTDILKRDPKNNHAQKEMGYLLLKSESYQEALPYFKKAQGTDPNNSDLAMQIGYLEDKLKNKKAAHAQFSKAYEHGDATRQQKACEALSNVDYWNRKRIPEPYFSDIYLAPYHSSRFDNQIFFGHTRFGANLGKRKEWEPYVGLRYTQDSESEGGQNLVLFEDNTVMLSLGTRYYLPIGIPLSAYAEAGQSYDLIDRNRPRRRDDFRAGLTSFKAWGSPFTCPTKTTYPFVWVGDFYADIGYYSRFDRNVIGYLRLRDGLRVWEHTTSALNVYLQAFGVVDSNDDFFNNVAEWGPALAFIPTHRLHLTLRYSLNKGHYLKVNGPSANPYKRDYTDHRYMIEFYQRF